ncbi:hypothetical protein BDEG_28684 [Batrachochytrium dendrobatidis JEL423]|uniref:Secreted protein n=1 Tax=Batrachochytrium dendrobatidis (strain JEL423) TaxID=403673 RepID=A0A177VZ39_BATDL|nr:hypothetical protein BDEG_28684 [Batrachochytrium dendrobatidis JEL423]
MDPHRPFISLLFLQLKLMVLLLIIPSHCNLLCPLQTMFHLECSTLHIHDQTLYQELLFVTQPQSLLPFNTRLLEFIREAQYLIIVHNLMNDQNKSFIYMNTNVK